MDRAERDAEICRLWQEKWTAPSIAELLDVSEYTVKNVVRKFGLTWRPRGSASQIERVEFKDAPIEAWQQAVIPSLERLAAQDGMSEQWCRAFVTLCLLRMKPYASLAEFKAWLLEATQYDCAELSAFLLGARDAGLIGPDEQPNPDAYILFDTGDAADISVAAIVVVGVLEGTFVRHPDSTYDVVRQPEPPSAPSTGNVA